MHAPALRYFTTFKKFLKTNSLRPAQYTVSFLPGLKGKILFPTHPVKGSQITLGHFFFIKRQKRNKREKKACNAQNLVVFFFCKGLQFCY